MTLTSARLNEVILNEERHKYYLETVKMADHLCFHIDGYEYPWYDEKQPYSKLKFGKLRDYISYQGSIFFDIIVGEYRPEESEDKKAYDYRIKTFKAITKSTVNQVITEFQKITRSSDWSVKFIEDVPVVGTEGTLEDYFNRYPRWSTFTNFIQSVLTKKVCADPNALAVVVPDRFPKRGEEMDDSVVINPVVRFFDSRHVLDYSDGEYAICFDEEDDTYCVFQKDRIDKFTKDKDALVLVMSWPYPKELRELNARKLKGIYIKSTSYQVLYDSFVSPMLPYLDKAAREGSDLDASTVRAMYPQRWQVEGMSCKHCQGTGRVARLGQPTACDHCNGQGSMIFSPSQTMIVKTDKLTDSQVPIPPSGFIEPSAAIIELQKSTIREHKYDALASLNLHFLDRTPLNESGKAKEVDRDSLHNSIQKVAENMVELADFIAQATNDIRYGKRVPSDEERDKMLPTIAVPEDFSIITAEAYLEEIDKAKKSGVTAATMREIEREYIVKRWRNNPEEAKRLLAYIDLNPAYGMDTASIAMSTEMDPIDKYIAINIMYLVDTAIDENEGFLDMDWGDQKEVVRKLAEEKAPSPAELGLEDEDIEEGEDVKKKPKSFRLTDEQIKRIKELDKIGIYQKDIAKRFGVSASTISEALRR